MDFQTIYEDENIEEIFIAGDLHGDLMALIILLRDCAKLIRLKDDTKTKYQDYLSETNLEKVFHNKFSQSLGYEWIGQNKYFVLVGDMLDNYRNTIPHLNDKSRSYFELPHEEIKLLLFINSLNRDIRINKKTGKIIKLIGNHELMNTYLDTNNNISKYAKTIHNGYRNTYFNYGQPGIDLLYDEGGIGVIIKIKDFVCVHGGLSNILDSLPEKYDKIFNELNNALKKYMYTGFIEQPYRDILFSEDGILWNRKFGAILAQKEEYRYKNMCPDLYKLFEKICMNENKCTNNTRLVISHCAQFVNTKTLSSYTNINSNEVTDTITVPVLNTKSSLKTGIMNGITVECQRNGNINEPALYRIDVGMSRSFDNPKMFHLEELKESILNNEAPNIAIIDEILELIISRTPQLLHIKCLPNNKYETEIIRSSFYNTMNNLNRQFLYETMDNKNFVISNDIILKKMKERYDEIYNTEDVKNIEMPGYEKNMEMPDYAKKIEKYKKKYTKLENYISASQNKSMHFVIRTNIPNGNMIY